MSASFRSPFDSDGFVPPAEVGKRPSRGREDETAEIQLEKSKGLSQRSESVEHNSGFRMTQRQQARPSVGLVIDDRYRLTEKLGEGGMGTVFVAEHLKLKKKVAVKLIKPELSRDPEVAARFAREAMVGGQLEHPHIASTLDYGSLEDGTAYLVMQFIRGFSLRELLVKAHDSGLGWRRACRVAAQIADALDAAHASGVVHRDLKPENVILEGRQGGGDLARVLDFGIARFAVARDEHRRLEESKGTSSRTHSALTVRGAIVGTLGYMAPEQATGQKVDFRADLYALGTLLWEMIAGRMLFASRDAMKVLALQLAEDIPPLPIADDDDGAAPKALHELMQTLLARWPKDRPKDAATVRDTLRRLVAPAGAEVDGAVVPEEKTDSLELTKHQSGRPRPSAAQAAVSASASRPRHKTPLSQDLAVPPQAPRPRSRRLAVVVLIVAIGAAIGAGLWLGQRQRHTPTTPVSSLTQVKTRFLSATDAASRREAAAQLQSIRPLSAVPEYLRALALFETTRTCRGKRTALVHLGALGEPSSLPVLRRYAATPQSGCGPLGVSDCLACLRTDLDKIIARLEHTSP
ncbi:MAG: protein kinase domain-containing protein [Polyangiales bacterium]